MQEWPAGRNRRWPIIHLFARRKQRERERVSRLCDDAINSESPPPVTYFL